MTTNAFLPYGRQLIEDDDVAAVAEILRGDWLTTGPATERLDAELARRTGAAFAVSCANGTAALHLAAMALDIGPGDIVVVPAITFAATANAVRYVGGEVEFADVDPETGLMRPRDAEAALARIRARGGRAKAIFPVHLAGQVCDMAGLASLGLPMVEDACHAIGGTDGDGVPVGACRHSAMAVFSFHPVKMIAMGEGGAVTTNSPELAARLRLLRGHGIERDPAAFVMPEAFDAAGQPNPWHYEMQELGFNFRISDINCALGLSQLAKLDRFAARRRELVARYDSRLAALAPLVRPTARVGGVPGWHLYVALIDFAAAGKDRGEVMRALKARGIGSQVHYIPVPWQPYYADRQGRPDLPGAEAWFRHCLSLPLFAGMTQDDVDRVVDALAEVLQ